jgi:glycosyltransferase involved in cell wall biosynthesis
MTHPMITVLMPSIPSRAVRRNIAMASVSSQTLQPAAVALAIDVNREGAPATRQRCLNMATTEWVAPLDDDDAFMPQHLDHLVKHALETGADYVYSWFQVVGGVDPFPAGHYLNPFDPNNPIETTITVLIKTELAKQIGYRSLERGEDTNTGEDFGMLMGAVKLGAKIEHLVERTWYWNHHAGNTSGLPTKGDSTKW